MLELTAEVSSAREASSASQESLEREREDGLRQARLLTERAEVAEQAVATAVEAAAASGQERERELEEQRERAAAAAEAAVQERERDLAEQREKAAAASAGASAAATEAEEALGALRQEKVGVCLDDAVCLWYAWVAKTLVDDDIARAGWGMTWCYAEIAEPLACFSS